MVIATNIAETSVTIADAVYVIDSGKLKENRFDARRVRGVRRGTTGVGPPDEVLPRVALLAGHGESGGDVDLASQRASEGWEGGPRATGAVLCSLHAREGGGGDEAVSGEAHGPIRDP